MVAQTLVQTLQLPLPLLLQKIRHDDLPPPLLLHHLRTNDHTFHSTTPITLPLLDSMALPIHPPQLPQTLTRNRTRPLLPHQHYTNLPPRQNTVGKHQRNGPHHHHFLRPRLGRVHPGVLLQHYPRCHRTIRPLCRTQNQ